METFPEVGTTEFDTMVSEWMNKEAFKVAPNPRPPVHIGPETQAFLEEVFAQDALQEWNKEKELKFQRSFLKRSKEPFYRKAPISKKRR